MRKYAAVALSFAVGSISTLLFIHTSTIVQRSFAQGVSSPYSAILGELKSKFGGSAVSSPPAMPIVPSVWLNINSVGFRSGNGVQQLDGINCKGCSVDVAVITYAGGQFRCEDCVFAKPKEIVLLGPALNTLQFLQLVGIVPPAKPEPPNPNAPALRTIEMTNKATRKNWVSPALGN